MISKPLRCAAVAAAFVSALFAVPALGQKAQADPTTPPRVVDRVFTDPAGGIVVSAGQLFVVALDANPSTGYHWIAAPDPDPAVSVLRGTTFLAATSGLVGAPGRELCVYEAMGPGTTALALSYVPPGSGGKPVKHVTFSVTVTPPDAR